MQMAEVTIPPLFGLHVFIYSAQSSRSLQDKYMPQLLEKLFFLLKSVHEEEGVLCWLIHIFIL